MVRIKKVSCQFHRVVWAMYYGYWPPNLLDHINGVRSDDRIVNLRLATSAENIRNSKKSKRNTSGYKGVSWHKAARKWEAHYYPDGAKKHLGLFADIEDAFAARDAAARELHGEFYNDGTTTASPDA